MEQLTIHLSLNMVIHFLTAGTEVIWINTSNYIIYLSQNAEICIYIIAK